MEVIVAYIIKSIALLGPISFVMPDDHLNVNYQPAVVHLA
jgi:hypothetical protein